MPVRYGRNKKQLTPDMQPGISRMGLHPAKLSVADVIHESLGGDTDTQAMVLRRSALFCDTAEGRTCLSDISTRHVE